MAYEAHWNSIRTHALPEWFRDGKFGIYTHWGLYSVPGRGPNGTWYPYNMYRPGTPQYEYHTKTYGRPEEFGYKDFIPMFTAERFDADEWAEMFAGAGAAVVVSDLKQETADAVAQGIVDAGGKAVGLACNVTKEADLEAAVQAGIDHFGSLTILVNNAGGGDPKRSTCRWRISAGPTS